MENFLSIGKNISFSKKKSNEENLIELKKIAETNNGKLLSTDWKGWDNKYLFSFQDGREFIKNAKDLRRTGWPKDPNLFFKLSTQQNKKPIELLEEIKKIAEINNGKLLSNEWRGTHYKYLFSFQDGREFTKTAKDLKKYGWPKDPDLYLNTSHSKSKTPNELITKLKELIEFNGGKLLSNEWKGWNAKYLFLDKDNILQNKRSDSIKKYFNDHKKNKHSNANEKIKKNVNLLTSNQEKNINKEDCLQTLNDIKFINKKAKNIEKTRNFIAQKNFNLMVEIAKSNNGKIISKEWMGRRANYEFMDSENNSFFCKFESLLQGVWSTPRGLVAEPICNQILEFMFSKKFIKTRKILTKEILKKSQPLELDGYCQELNIAFEYQGWPGHWDKNHKSYPLIQKRDKLKKEYCKKLNIILIEIMPFKNNSMYDENLSFSHVLNAVKIAYLNNNKELPKIKTSGFKLDLKLIHHGNNMLSQLRELARENNGKLLTESWQGDKHHYLFSDSNGVEFKSTARGIKLAGWPKDVKNFIANQNSQKKTSLEKFKALANIAILNNGKIISEEWLGSLKNHIFETEDGIQFESRANNILNGGWSKKFSKK